MAKGKHATALFEVIHSARRPPLNSPAVKMPPPRSWWKGRAKRVDSIEALRGLAPTQEPATFVPPSVSAAPPAAVEPPPRRSVAPAPEPQYREPEYEPAYEPQYIDHIEPTPIEPTPEPPPARPAERSVQVNSGDGAFSFRLSYGGAAAAGFILLLLIAIAFLAGTRTSDSTPADDEASATSTADTGSSGSGMLAAVTPGAPQSSTVQPANTLQPSALIPTTPPAASDTPAVSARSVVRRVGLNYVIVQSYPSLETAQRAADFLTQNSIPCSVVHGLAGWTLRSWYTVVGAQPFDHVQHNPALDAYKARIKTLGDQFAGHNAFNRFEPSAYAWRADSDEDAAQ